jgi:hypothetical protein
VGLLRLSPGTAHRQRSAPDFSYISSVAKNEARTYKDLSVETGSHINMELFPVMISIIKVPEPKANAAMQPASGHHRIQQWADKIMPETISPLLPLVLNRMKRLTCIDYNPSAPYRYYRSLDRRRRRGHISWRYVVNTTAGNHELTLKGRTSGALASQAL